jgi:hypothetical protein
MSANYQGCNLNRLLTDGACFRDGAGIFEDNREAIDVYLRERALAAAGGPDYVAAGFNVLLADAASWIAPTLIMTCDQRQAVALQIDLENAIFDGATFPTDINSLKASSRHALSLGKEQRRNLMLYLRCQINSRGKPV